MNDETKLAHAATYWVWLHSPHPTAAALEKFADYAPPAVGAEADTMTAGFRVPVREVIDILQTMIATELKSAYAYMAYAQQLRGLSRNSLADEFDKHVAQEAEHAQYLIRRASVLGGPVQLPAIEAPPGSVDPVDIVTRMVRIEQEGLAQWKVLHSVLEDTNPMRVKVEEYMAQEEEHTDDLIRMLPAGTLPTALESEIEEQAAPPQAPALEAGAPKIAFFGLKRAEYAPVAELPVSGADAQIALEQEAQAAEAQAASAYFEQQARAKRQEVEQLQAQLQQMAAQMQQQEQNLQQQQALQQQQQQALQQANDTTARSLASQIQSMQEANSLREQTTNTIAGHDAWRQQVQAFAQQLAQATSQPPPNPNLPQDPAASADEAQLAPSEGQEADPGLQMQQGEQEGAPKTAGAWSVARDTFAKGLKDQFGSGKVDKVSLGLAALGTAGGAFKGYHEAKSGDSLAQAQLSADRAEARHQEKGTFWSALQLARARAGKAEAEVAKEHPMLGAVKGGIGGASVGVSASRLLSEVQKARSMFNNKG